MYIEVSRGLRDDCARNPEKMGHLDSGIVDHFQLDLVSESKQCLHPQAAYIGKKNY